MDNRPSWHRTYLDICAAWAKRSTCVKLAVGCVLVDAQHRELAQGFNGVATGAAHCNEMMKITYKHALRCVEFEDNPHGRKYERTSLHSVEGKEIFHRGTDGALFTRLHECDGANLPPGSDKCQAVHAEHNALLKCRDPDRIDTIYSSVSPCFRCMKGFLNTGALHIVFSQPYQTDPHTTKVWTESRAGRTWQQY